MIEPSNPGQTSQSAAASNSGSASSPLAARGRFPRPWIYEYLPIALISAAILVFTRAFSLGDTTAYANQIYDAAVSRVAQPSGLLWEFGHVIWRPLGFALYEAVGRALPDWPVPWLRIAACLIAISLACSWIAALLFYSIGRCLGLSRLAATALSIALICSNAFLDYAHAGHSYVPGTMFLAAAVRVLLGPAARGSRAAWAGIFAGLSALLWFPFVLTLPAIVALAAWWSPESAPRPAPERLRLSISVTLSAAAALAVGYGVAILALRLFSMPAILAWYREANHGLLPAPSFTRTVFGIARAIVYTDDGIQFKRFLLHDPYARVTLAELLGTTLVKVALVYLAMLAAGIALWRSAPGRVALWITLISAIPNLLFANFLFEPGEMSRYLFLLPFLCVCGAIVFAQSRTPRPLKAALALALAAFTAWDLAAMGAPAIHSRENAVASRAQLFAPVLRPDSFAAVLNYQDELFAFTETYPFNPLNRNLPHLVDLIEPGSVRIPTWKQEFATEALAAWSRSGDVWITKRALAPVPSRDWHWAEGIDHSVAWKDLPAFFTRLETDADVGGADGFVRVAPSAANQQFLNRIGILRDQPGAPSPRPASPAAP